MDIDKYFKNDTKIIESPFTVKARDTLHHGSDWQILANKYNTPNQESPGLRHR